MEQLQTENSAAGGLSDLTDVLGFPPVLDACCGSRMFWFNKQDERAIFVDKRSDVFDIAPDKAYPNGSRIVVRPDRQADFTDLPFPDDTFALVVFDPPHLTRVGDSSLLAKKYGKLTGEWQEMIRGGFAECFRVLRPEGVLIFKWADSDHSLSSILSLTNHKPLFGHKTRQHAKTHWVTFMKPNQTAKRAATRKG